MHALRVAQGLFEAVIPPEQFSEHHEIRGTKNA
jgi:hypothetical protein